MRALLTVARADGTFPTVGTDNRSITHDTTERGIRRIARNAARHYGRRVRVEILDPVNIYRETVREWTEGD